MVWNRHKNVAELNLYIGTLLCQSAKLMNAILLIVDLKTNTNVETSGNNFLNMFFFDHLKANLAVIFLYGYLETFF